jgi:ribosomal protein S18 acetylase RimI-like enzyme
MSEAGPATSGWCIAAAADCRPEALHAAFVAAFADHLAGPFKVPLSAWPYTLARQGVDLELSRVALDAAGGIAAFALIAPRPRHRRWRIAVMGALPAARGTGAAPALLDDSIARAAAAGQQAIELECFAQNERALRLYQQRGFEGRHDLRAYAAAPAPVGAAAGVDIPGVEAVALDDACAHIDAIEAQIPDLPLQVCSAVLRASHAVTPLQAWRSDRAMAVFSMQSGVDGARVIVIHCLVDPDPAQAAAVRIARVLRLLHPEVEIKVPPLQRSDVGGRALLLAGFEPQALHQRWMLKSLLEPAHAPSAPGPMRAPA